jgi:signal transduction histidine kinase
VWGPEGSPVGCAVLGFNASLDHAPAESVRTTAATASLAAAVEAVRADKLDQERAEAVRLHESKKMFISVLSHEIRTYVTFCTDTAR